MIFNNLIDTKTQKPVEIEEDAVEFTKWKKEQLREIEIAAKLAASKFAQIKVSVIE